MYSKKTISTIILTFFLISTSIFAQFKVKDITDSLHQATLKSFDDERITSFLEVFAEDLKNYSWEKIRPHCYDAHVESQTRLMTDDAYGYEGSRHPDSLKIAYIRDILNTPYYEWTLFSDDFQSASRIKDFNTIEEVHFIESKDWKLKHDEKAEKMWTVRFILKTTEGKYYMARIFCIVQRTDGKVFALDSSG